MRGASRKPDVPTLVAGLALFALGVALLLDSVEAIELRFATLAPIVCAAIGAVLLASGLARRD